MEPHGTNDLERRVHDNQRKPGRRRCCTNLAADQLQYGQPCRLLLQGTSTTGRPRYARTYKFTSPFVALFFGPRGGAHFGLPSRYDRTYNTVSVRSPGVPHSLFNDQSGEHLDAPLHEVRVFCAIDMPLYAGTTVQKRAVASSNWQAT